ncbi:MAG: hypothetical protein ACSHX9_15265 [Luteolibacter sp.]
MRISKRQFAVVGLFVFFSVIVVAAYRWAFPPSHEHCIKVAGMFFHSYASDHEGKFPESERGWGDALLKLHDYDGSDNFAFVVGVDDDGSHLLYALRTGSDVDEDRCTRVYVQGLTKDSSGQIAILFDRESVPGGDHFRSRFGEPLREFLRVDQSSGKVLDPDWPEFVATQRQFLREQGFDEASIDAVYGEYE